MDTAQIIKKAARQLNDTDEDNARLYFDAFLAIISKALQKGDDVSLIEFGDFSLDLQNETPCETDKNLISMRKMIRKVVFIPSSKLEELINRW